MEKAKNNNIQLGPNKEAYIKEKVIPVIFNGDSPFTDLRREFAIIEENIKNGELTDIIIVQRIKRDDGHLIRPTWRGKSSLTMALGLLKFAEIMLYDESIGLIY